jgi:hypothetical protein
MEGRRTMERPRKQTRACRGVCESARELRTVWEGDRREARSAPDWGHPTVRDRRGACGNVDHGGTRHPPRLSKERVLETLRLKLCAPQFYPDHQRCIEKPQDNIENRA